MALYLNGTNVATSAKIIYNGTEIKSIVYNGTTVWSKPSGEWKNIWSGSLIVTPDIDFDIIPSIDAGESNGAASGVAYYTGMSDANITGFELSIDATIYEIEMDYETWDVYRVDPRNTIYMDSGAKLSNVPQTFLEGDHETTIYKPISSGSNVIQNADLGWDVSGTRLSFSECEVQNLYKYVDDSQSGTTYTNIIDTVGTEDNVRLRSGGATASADGFASNYFSVKAGDIIRVEFPNGNRASIPSNGMYCVLYSDTNGTVVATYDAGSSSTVLKNATTTGYEIHIPASVNCSYARVAGAPAGAYAGWIVTVNEEIL